MVTRASPSGKQFPPPTQGVQSPSRKEPDECVHLPSGQISQAVLSNSSFHEPAGHEVQADAPVKALYFPGGQRMHTLTLACPSAG